MKNKKEFFVSSTRKILREKRIQWTEMEASTGTIYFKLKLENSSPCLRLSDHYCGKKKPSMTLYWIVGENAKEKNIYHRIEIMINKMIRQSKLGKVIQALEDLKV